MRHSVAPTCQSAHTVLVVVRVLHQVWFPVKSSELDSADVIVTRQCSDSCVTQQLATADLTLSWP